LKSKVFFAGFLAVLALLHFGCVSNKSVQDDVPDMLVSAKGVPEGIEIYFDNIPQETNSLFVTLHDATENYEIMSCIMILDEELETLKNTKNLLCPFTEKGHVYRISISYSQDNIVTDDSIYVAATARGGNYPREMHFVGPPIYENIWTVGKVRKIDSIALF